MPHNIEVRIQELCRAAVPILRINREMRVAASTRRSPEARDLFRQFPSLRAIRAVPTENSEGMEKSGD
jgi:hypothetical protein